MKNFALCIAGLNVLAIVVNVMLIQKSGYNKARRAHLIQLLEKLDITIRRAEPIFGQGYGCGNDAPASHEQPYFAASDEALRALNLSYVFVSRKKYEIVRNFIIQLNHAVSDATRRTDHQVAKDLFHNKIVQEYDSVRKIIGSALKGLFSFY